MSRHVGLIIGINHYQDSTFHPLQFAENDAKALAQWLVNSEGGKWSPPDIQLVQGQHATRELTESLIAQLCTKVDPDDIVLIYFAGHAFLDTQTGDGYLALANTRYQDVASGLSLRTFVHNILSQSRAAQVLCILDVFQTGDLWNTRRSSPFDMKPLLGPSVLKTLQHQQNRLILCSCRGNNSAPEIGEHNIGSFVRSMIVGLCGPASEASTSNVTFSKLHAYLLSALQEQHRPQLFGQQQLPLILVGDLSTSNAQQVPNNHPPTAGSKPSPSLLNLQRTGGLLNLKANPQASVATQAPSPSQGPFTSGHIFAPALEEHRQQQYQQLLAQAQQFLQNQNYGAAFDTVEKALKLVPNNTSALILKVQLLGTARRFQEALAITEQILQTEPNNAMVWSMRAAVLSNMGQYQPALSAVERSLELDPKEETYTIKATIMANLSGGQNHNPYPLNPTNNTSQEQQARENPRAFFIGAGLHVLGFICGMLGAGLLFSNQLPSFIGILLASFGLAVLCISAARGAFRYGLSRMLLTLLVCLFIGGILGAVYKLGFTKIINSLSNDNTPMRLIQFLFFAVWMVVAATTPFMLAIGGFISGLIVRARRA